MNYRILIPACILAAALLAGCNKDENIQGLTNISTTTFHASIESGGTKTVLGNGESDTESHPVLWTPGDAIGITATSAFGRYEYRGTEDTDFAEFEGEPIQGDLFYAVYPYSAKTAMFLIPLRPPCRAVSCPWNFPLYSSTQRRHLPPRILLWWPGVRVLNWNSRISAAC